MSSALVISPVFKSCAHATDSSGAGAYSGNGMQLSYKPYELELTHVFTLAGSSRRTTPVMLTQIHFEGLTGYGEASMPPYLGESHQTVEAFLKKVDLAQFKDPFQLEEIIEYIDGLAPGNYAAKASVDIALHDLVGKLMKQPWYKIWGLNPQKVPDTSFTIGIDTPEVVKEKTREAAPYNILKIKLGHDTDKAMVEAIREITDKPLCVDVNQGWKDREKALDMIYWLEEKGVVFVEQPMPVEAIEDMAWLTANSPLPTIADEALQGPADIQKLYGVYDGINIKLMKCGGMRAAHKMASIAGGMNMKVMLGCMTETSCAVTAMAHLGHLAQWADLDGNLLINNDVFDGLRVVKGKVILPERPGIGVVPV